MSRRTIFAVCILTLCLVLTACSGSAPTAAPSQPQNPTAQGETAAPAQPAEPTSAPATPTEEAQRGPGSFDLPDPTVGLDTVANYHVIMRMAFDGSQDGQPLQVQKSYRVLNRDDESARFLQYTKTLTDGSTDQEFSGTLGSVRYSKLGLSQPCQAGLVEVQSAPFDPAAQLPRLAGAEPAGQETVFDIPTDVYTFDQRAIGAGEAATANGKVWIAQQGGYIVQYTLTMESDTVFGPGISGKQFWEYAINTQPASAAEEIPDDCPLPLTDVPTMADAANLIHLPGEVRYQTLSGKDAIAAFYTEQFTAGGYQPQGEAVETSGGTRWLFGKQEAEKAVIMLLTVKPADSGTEVRVTRILTEPPPAQGQ